MPRHPPTPPKAQHNAASYILGTPLATYPHPITQPTEHSSSSTHTIVKHLPVQQQTAKHCIPHDFFFFLINVIPESGRETGAVH